MTLGDNIWWQALSQVEYDRLDKDVIAALGKLVIAAINDCIDALELDHTSEIEAMEHAYNDYW